MRMPKGGAPAGDGTSLYALLEGAEGGPPPGVYV